MRISSSLRIAGSTDFCDLWTLEANFFLVNSLIHHTNMVNDTNHEYICV